MSQSEHALLYPDEITHADLDQPSLLAKIRSVIFLCLMIFITLLMGVVLLPVLLFGEHAVRKAIKIWARIIMSCLHFICGLRYEIIGNENIPSGAALIASNHQSMWETIALFDILPNPTLAFKKELLSLPIYAWWGKSGGGIAIDRSAGAKAIKKLNADARTKIESGVQVVLFPEGTRAPPGTIGHLKPGIAGLYRATNAPCTPALHNSGNYWRHPGPWKTPGTITIAFMPAIATGLKRKEFMNKLDMTLRSSATEKTSPSSEPEIR